MIRGIIDIIKAIAPILWFLLDGIVDFLYFAGDLFDFF